MLILLYIFLGYLFIDGLLICCLHFRKERPLKKYEDQLNDLKTEKSTY